MTRFHLHRTRAFAALGLALTAALIAACGGGTTQVDPFVPKRVLVLGDETSLLESDGRKWSVNQINATTKALECGSNALWVQYVTGLYGFAFKECNPDNLTAFNAVMLAARNAKVADMATQVAPANVGTGDLITVMAGANDVLELQKAVTANTRTKADAIAEASARGKALGLFVNAMVAKDARVIVSTLLDVAYTPYGITLGGDTQLLLGDLSTAFNTALRITMLNDGRFVGMVLADEELKKAARFPGSISLDTSTISSVTQAACATALPDCNNETLVTGAGALTWLWADNERVGVRMHERLGSLAAARARSNPF
jgi:outer membrane lipase/esterase